jgi:predicted dienelactone hydrolase
VSPTPSATATATPLDPNGFGPYAVGSTAALFVRQSSTTDEPRPLNTVIWYPAPAGTTGTAFVSGVLNAPIADGGPFPLLVFSHGSCGIPQQSTFLTSLLVSYGFIVAAPPHPGNTLLDGPPTVERCLGAPLVDSFFNRADDIVFVIDEMIALSAGTTAALAGAVDADRIGVFGHSFGAQTVLRIPAADSRVDAVLSLAPGRTDLVLPQVDQINVPTMIQCGEIDSLVPFANCQTTYDHLRQPRFLLEILNTGHYAFANLCLSVTGSVFQDCAEGTLSQEEAHTFVNGFAVPFFGRYVAGDERWTPLLDAGSEPQGVVYVAEP